jgi:uncharacterized repeat protein (TIGR01451 family)
MIKTMNYRLGISGLLFISQGLISTAWAGVSGMVYQDLPVNGTTLNTYGVKDANELGVSGITVTAYPDGLSTTTANDGTWSLATTGDVRVEFSNIPQYLKESADGGVGNASVQFISDGGTANLGLHNPTDYSSNVDPLISLPRFEPNIVVGSTALALGSVAYSSTGLNSDYTNEFGSPAAGPVPNADANAGEIGSVWGTAWQSDQQRLFAGTFLKRHAGLADGPGYVYVLDYSTTPAIVAHKFNLSGMTPVNGGAAIDFGSVCRRSATDGEPNDSCDPTATGIASDYTLPTSSGAPSVDMDAYAKVGIVGFGDLDMQENTSTLWMINPYQKALISIDVSAASTSLPGAVNQYPLASINNWPTCTTGELRPWALNFNAGRGYLGVICDASTSQNRTDLHAYVLSFNPDNLATGFSPELDFSMGYGRHVFAYDRIDFNAWTFTYPPVGMASLNNERIYPQPLLSDIEFDKHNNMYLNFMDRWGHQVGGYNYEPLSGNTTMIKTPVGGEIIKVCNINGTWELEGDTNCPVAWVTNTSGVTGSGEYFDDAAADGTIESTEGALAILKGSGQLVSNTMDPHPSGATGVDYWNTQGVTTWDLETGGIDNWYSIEYGVGLGNAFWGKAHGMGDIEVLTDPAPIEVGNRVWLDSDNDGVQDASEAGIAGVTVELRSGTSTLATATTDANGNYIFSNDPNGTSTASHRYNITSLTADSAYTVRIPNVAGGSKQAALGANNLTTSNSGEGTQTDSNDSDGVASGDHADAPILAVDIPYAGANNHSYDFGFRNDPAPPSGCVTLTNTVTVTATETDVDASNNTASADLQVNCSSTPSVDLVLTKTASNTNVASGDTTTYTLTVSNAGPDNATGVAVSDQLPAGVSYSTHNASQGTYDNNTGIWTVGNLTNGANATLMIEVSMD